MNLQKISKAIIAISLGVFLVSPQAFSETSSGASKRFVLSAQEMKLGATPQLLRVENKSPEKTAYSVKATVPWITVMPQSGQIDPGSLAVITVQRDPSAKPASSTQADIAVVVTDTQSGDEYKAAIVYESKEAKAELRVSQGSLEFSGVQGKAIAPQSFDIQNTGNAPLNFKIQSGAAWLIVQPDAGTLDAGKAARISVNSNPENMQPGKKEAVLKITSDGAANSPQQVKVVAAVNKKPSGKKTKAPLSDPKTGMVELAGGLWEKREEGTDKSQYARGVVPGALKGLVLPIGDADKEYWTETRMGSSGHYDEVELMYSRELHLMERTPRKGYTPSKIIVWQMHVAMNLFSPRAQWGGEPEQEYISTAGSWRSQEQHGAVPQRGVSGADKSYVTQRINKQYGAEKTGESWHFIVLKDGVSFTLEASTYNDTVQRFGIEPNFYPWVEQLVKEISAKKWLSIFRQGNSKYEKLPDFMKPFVINKGLLNADGILLRQVGTSDWTSLSLHYWTNDYNRDTGVYGLTANVTVTFYVPRDKGEEMAVRFSMLPAQDEYNDYSKVSFGDGGYKTVSKKYPTDVNYLVRVGAGTVNVGLTSGRTILNPPADILEELVAKMRTVDYAAIEAYTGSPESEEEYVEEVLDEEAFEDAPPADLDPSFWDPGYDPAVGGVRVALPETPGQPAVDPTTYQPQPGDKSTNGLVWSGVYGDWVRGEVFDNEQQQKKLGRVWQGDQRGWETPSETKERDENLQKFEKGNEVADAEEREKLKKITDAIQEARDNLKNLKEKAAKREELMAKLDQLEKEREQAEKDAKWNSSAVINATAERIAREVATGQTAEGATSFKAMGLRMLAGVVSGGSSEIVYASADGCYRVYDNLLKGDSMMAAVGKTVATMAAEEAFGRAVSGLAAYAGKKGSEVGRKLIGEAAETGTANLPKGLAKTKNAVEKALKETPAMKETAALRKKYSISAKEDVDLLIQQGRIKPKEAIKLKQALGDEAAKTREILALYKQDGMKKLSELERKGHLGTNEAKKINDVVSREVNDSIDKGVKKTMGEFEEKTGVKIKEVMVGDSGSSAGRKARSIKTDADRTVVVDFDEASLKAYADKNCKGNVQEAYDKLSKKFAAKQDSLVAKELEKKGVSAKAVDYKTYDRFGKPGLDDSYPGTFVKTVQATKGKTTVYKTGKVQDDGKFSKFADGQVKTVKTSGQTIVDQEALINQKISGTAVVEGPKIDTGESGALMAQQKQALAKSGVTAEKAAKALERADKALALDGAAKNLEILKAGGKVSDLITTPRIDPDLLAKAKAIRDNPQQVKQILGNQSEEAFVKELEDAVDGAASK